MLIPRYQIDLSRYCNSGFVQIPDMCLIASPYQSRGFISSVACSPPSYFVQCRQTSDAAYICSSFEFRLLKKLCHFSHWPTCPVPILVCLPLSVYIASACFDSNPLPTMQYLCSSMSLPLVSFHTQCSTLAVLALVLIPAALVGPSALRCRCRFLRSPAIDDRPSDAAFTASISGGQMK